MKFLDQPYNREIFFSFLKEFLPDFSKDVRKVNSDHFKATSQVSFLGESNDLDLSVFEIEHQSTHDARVKLASDGFRLMKNHGVYTALVVYKTEKNQNWRLSLLTTSLSDKKTGGVKTEFSNPRRYSFFLGPDAKINTPNQFLIKKGQVKNYEDLKSRFSIEVVNKEFYKQISQKFTQLVGGTLGTGKKQLTYQPQLKLPSTTDHSQTSLEFGVRLIGRIIFCWFLREKKSKHAKALMPKSLLSLEAINKHPDFYHSVLEPVFFEVLNRKIDSRLEDFSSKPFSFIPYLNGGLFSPIEHLDFYKRTNGDLQSQFHNTLVIPDKWFKELFEVLETYNFTIDENTSFDEELSIDPEMLGRIFENLLAEINPETGESARKSTGSYYTPRVIVEYMVDESLLLYLKQQTKIKEEKLRAIISYDLTDDSKYPLDQNEKEDVATALEKLKLLDPACGSGAFPIGALQKIVFILQCIDPDGKLWFRKQIEKLPPELRRKMEREHEYENYDYIRKLGIIRKNIYGVDIQPIATEISRLRCFLTLVVDQYVKDGEPNRNIEPLPNLDFKFVTANSLISLPKINNSGQTEMFDNTERIDELKDIRDQYFNASGVEREQLKTEFATQQTRLLRELQKEHGWTGIVKAELTQKLTDWEPFTHKTTPWFDPEWMFGIKKGFSVVIGNPPYLGEKGNKNIFEPINNSVLGKHHLGRMDIFYYFFHLAMNITSHTGIVTFISTNYYITANGANKLRKDIKERAVIYQLINLNEIKIFDSAEGQHNMITMLGKSDNKSVLANTTVTNRAGKVNSDILNSVLHRKDNKTIYYKISQQNLFDGGKNYLRLEGTSNTSNNPLIILLNKIKNKCIPLSNLANVNNGLRSGIDTYKDNQNKKKGVFVLSEKEVSTIYGSIVARESLVKKYYKNSDIFKHFVLRDTNKYIIYTGKDIDISKYPKTNKHLLEFKNIIQKKRWKEPIPWYSLVRARDEQIFKSEKIVCPQRSLINTFGYSSEQWFAGSDVFFITKDHNKSQDIDLKYILAILNSKLIYIWLYYRGKRKGKNLELIATPVSEIPIKVVYKDLQKPLIGLVNKIIKITFEKSYNPENPPRRQKELEKQIDQLVYKLYGLTPEEIAIVEEYSR